MPYLMILVPFCALVLLNAVNPRLRERVSFWVCLLLLLGEMLVALLAPLGVWEQVFFSHLEAALHFHLCIDAFSAVLLFSCGLVGLSALAVCRFTISAEEERFKLKNLLLVVLIGINGLAMVKDLFSLYVFIEIIAVAAFILTALFRNKGALEGALKYLILSVVATVLLLSSLSLFLLTTGGVSFEEIKNSLSLPQNALLNQLAITLFICGLFIKAGLVPFHGWLPDAYTEAPDAVSILLAGIITKACGIFSLLRLLTSVTGLGDPIRNLLLLVGSLSIVIGALAALGQKDFKRMLAYSSISQMGYIVLSLGAGTALGIWAALFHFFNHAVFKTQLFANAAAVEAQTKSRDLSALGGLANNMPVTGTTSAIAALSTAGIPPLSGFWSKLLIILALWGSGLYFYAVIAVLASLLTLAYFLLLQRMVFFGQVEEKLKNVTEARAGLLLPAVVLSVIIVAVGMGFPFLLPWFIAR